MDFLENIDSHNRYLVGKGLEWRNLKLIFSVSEISIYSGLRRPSDLSYLNPLSSHLEVEFNNRQNEIGTDSGNAVWQISTDLIPVKNIRFSSNFVVDELIFDKIELDSGKANGIAYSFRLAFTNELTNNSLFTFDIFYINVGSNTFRHEDGYNNFVHRSLPLGWEFGSDGINFK